MINNDYNIQDFYTKNRLKYLNECLAKMDMDDVRQSIEYLINEAGNNNMEAQSRLCELAENFSNLNVSFNNLVEFIEKKFTIK